MASSSAVRPSGMALASLSLMSSTRWLKSTRKRGRSEKAIRQNSSWTLATANVQDEFCLIAFSDRPRFLVDFNQRVEDISDKLANAIPEGRTALLDAIYMGLTEMRHATNPRKALLIISDGGDNRSRYTAREIREMVMES